VNYDDYLVFPPTILIDNQEQRPYVMDDLEPDLSTDLDPEDLRPYDFHGILADAKEKNRPVVVRTRVANLFWGDYSLDGLQHKVAVERKSAADFFSTLTHGRDRFEREVASLNSTFEAACVVIEGSWGGMLKSPPTKANPKSILRTYIAWMQRYPRVHWVPVEDRRLGELFTFRYLERYWRDRLAGQSATV
jgi:ERCC4-type nuclease